MRVVVAEVSSIMVGMSTCQVFLIGGQVFQCFLPCPMPCTMKPCSDCLQDIDWAISAKVDFIAVSFVRTADVITNLRSYIETRLSALAAEDDTGLSAVAACRACWVLITALLDSCSHSCCCSHHTLHWSVHATVAASVMYRMALAVHGHVSVSFLCSLKFLPHEPRLAP